MDTAHVSLSGTSMSPHVAGAAALLSRHIRLAAESKSETLQKHCIDFNEVSSYGWGRIDVTVLASETPHW